MYKKINIFETSKIYNLLISFLFVLLLSLNINTIHKTERSINDLKDKINIAVFLATDDKIDIVGEKIRNIDGVCETIFYDVTTIQNNVSKIIPNIRELVEENENKVFTPYFIVKTDFLTVREFLNLKEEIIKIPQVSDVLFDENILSIIEELSNLLHMYKFILTFIIIILGIFLISKIIWLLIIKRFRIKHLLINLLGGILSGLFASGIYFILTNKIFVSNSLQLPKIAYLYLIIVGIITELLLEGTDRT